MKTFPFLIGAFLFLWTGCPIQAQNSTFETGPEVGPSSIFLWSYQDLQFSSQPTVGFSGGWFVQYQLKNRLYLRTSLSFERKGSLSAFPIQNIEGDQIGFPNTRSNYNYLVLPVLAHVKFGKKSRFFFNAGPFLGLLLRQTSLSEGGSSQEYTDLFKRLDAGVTTGLGLTFPVQANLDVSVELRNNLGMINTSKVLTFASGTVNTNSTNLLIGLVYKPGKGNSSIK